MKSLLLMELIMLQKMVLVKEILLKLNGYVVTIMEEDTKYLRQNKKNGVEDLKKAKQYIDFLIQKKVEKSKKV